MSANKHPWVMFDSEKGYLCRQATGRLRKNRWEIKKPNGLVVELDDDDFEDLRQGLPVKGL